MLNCQHMTTKTVNQPAIISFPLAGLRPLYSNPRSKKLVIEVDVESMKKINEPNTIDEMVAEARLDYALGDYKSFDNVENLIKDLRS